MNSLGSGDITLIYTLHPKAGVATTTFTITNGNGTITADTAGYNKNPDIVAPGTHMQGLRVPGGFLDQAHPDAVFGDRFFRGSGTSEAAAIASGASTVSGSLRASASATSDA